jgi:uncharacterized protein YecE (DUF72 family)
VTPRPVHVGCSGWNYRDWRGVLYPEGLPQRRWLERYAEVFDTVEINATFYRLPSESAVRGWVASSPDGFTFAVKVSRYLTHVKRLTEPAQGFGRFFDAIAPLRDDGKLGPILWQLPETFHRDDERLRAVLATVPPGRHCFEFRHPSWFVPEVYAILRRGGAALVIGDDPRRPFQRRELTADWTYVRFHRGSRGRGGNYSERELESWKRRIAAWRSRTEVFAYFNNDWKAYAVHNGRWLARHLGP